ncbi:MAG: hypothetical protein K2M50_00710 [Treponemataceae bacterium]|nr:hypothetical protein [Treponema sp.]MBD5413842.1 hypothetical protein [Treponema sp.]MBD5442707.1 hypothetical protein [Treponema sp.]MDE6244159.1 hypothetical protein [Treponemataceae bacterium]
MKILVLSLPQNIQQCKYISDYLSHYKEECLTVENQADFFHLIFTREFNADLLIIDYNHFNHLILNVYKYLMNDYFCYIPTIFINDPQEDMEARVAYWKNIIEVVYGNKIENFSRYKKTLILIDNALQDYCSQDNAQIDKTEFNFTLPLHLTASAYIIYETLISSQSKYLSIREIKNTIKKNKKVPSDTTIKCAISKIRNELKKSDNNAKIIKYKDGYRLIHTNDFDSRQISSSKTISKN